MIMAIKSKRVRKTAPALQSRLDMERCVGEIAKLQIERDGLLVEMDSRLQAIREEYETRLADVTGDLDAEMAIAKEWSEANPGEFGAKKSIEFTHGTAGFRTGMPKLKTLRGFTWDRVLEKLAAMKLVQYIRTRSEPDKERMLADRETLAETMPLMGVQCVQDETFFVEIKREEAAEGDAK